MRNALDVLDNSDRTKRLKQSFRFINSRRQAKNLRSILSTRKYIASNEVFGSFKCGTPRCKTCKLIEQTDTVQIKSTGQSFSLKFKGDCLSKYVLYIITCNGCGEQYIGETSTALKDRMTFHRQQIRHKEYTILGVSQHIEQCGRGLFRVAPFYKLNNTDEQFRKCKEQYFIKKFKPSLNNLHVKH